MLEGGNTARGTKKKMVVSTEVKRRAGGCTGLHAIHSRDKVQANIGS